MSLPSRSSDDHSITVADRTVAALGPHSSSFTLAWLASHRDRLRTLLLGGRRLSLLVVWDREGRTPAPERSQLEVDAIETVVYGPKRAARQRAALIDALRRSNELLSGGTSQHHREEVEHIQAVNYRLLRDSDPEGLTDRTVA